MNPSIWTVWRWWLLSYCDWPLGPLDRFAELAWQSFLAALGAVTRLCMVALWPVVTLLALACSPKLRRAMEQEMKESP